MRAFFQGRGWGRITPQADTNSGLDFYRPGRIGRSPRTVWMILLISLLFLIFSRVLPLKCCPSLSDEGYLVYGSHRVLAGQTPGADFHAYAPARYLFLASAFRIFGESLFVARLALMISSIIFGLFLTWAVARFCGWFWAIGPLLAFVLAPGPGHKIFFPLAVMIYSLFWFPGENYNNHKKPLLLALGSVVALLLREEAGLILFFWSLLSLSFPLGGLPAGLSISFFNVLRLFRFKPALKNCTYFLLYYTAILGLLLVLLFPLNRIPAMIGFYFHELASLTGTDFFNPNLNPLPFPLESLDLAFGQNTWLPLTIYLMLAGQLLCLGVALLSKGSLNRKTRRIMLFSAYVGLFGAWQAVTQPDVSHFLQSANLCYFSLAVLFYLLWKSIGFKSKPRAMVIKAVLISC